MRVLIIGGYGTFGFRIAERLSNESELELILAGRSWDKASAACAKLSGIATFTPLQLDRTLNLAAQIDTPPDLIIDASGPFQAYRGSPVLDYALAHGCHYADLSDDGAFVADVVSRDADAKSAKIILVSGLSTCPVLSAIGLREIEPHIGPATDVTMGIAPSPKAELGHNVVAAVTNYAGQETVAVRRGGQHVNVAGLTEVRAETICVPGGRPLPRLPFAVADAPDAWILPKTFPQLNHVWTGAGTRPIWLHRLLIGLSRLVAWGMFPKLAPFAGLFHRARGLFRFGQHRGGMFVRASNSETSASWHLVAEGDHGPYIPALPAVALVRQILRGRKPAAGAYSGADVIDLSALKPGFARLDISYGVQFDGADLPVYEKVLGDSYTDLSPAIQALHRTGDGRWFSGQCEITRGRNPLSHIVAALFRFPKAGQNIPVALEIKPDADGERWTRNFGGRDMSSHHRLGTGRQSRLIVEQFGPFAIHMAIIEEAGNLRIVTEGWSAFGMPLPKFLKPGGDVFETERDGRFIFHVDLQAPVFGRLVKYVGWLESAAPPTKSE